MHVRKKRVLLDPCVPTNAYQFYWVPVPDPTSLETSQVSVSGLERLTYETPHICLLSRPEEYYGGRGADAPKKISCGAREATPNHPLCGNTCQPS